MQFLKSEDLLWALGCLLYGLTCLVLYLRESYKEVPLFALWMTEAFLGSISLVFFARFTSRLHYAEAYWLFAVVENLLQLAVAYEFADKALRQKGRWIKETKVPLGLSVGMALVFSGLVASTAKPAAIDALDFYFTRVTLFVSIFMFLISTATLGMVYRSGSFWRRADLFRFFGFLVWAAASAIIDTLHVYWRTAQYFGMLDTIHVALSEVVVLYWAVTTFSVRTQRSSASGVGEAELFASLRQLVSTDSVQQRRRS